MISQGIEVREKVGKIVVPQSMLSKISMLLNFLCGLSLWSLENYPSPSLEVFDSQKSGKNCWPLILSKIGVLLIFLLAMLMEPMYLENNINPSPEVFHR